MTQATISVERCRRWVRAQSKRTVREIERLGSTRGLATDEQLVKLIAAVRDYDSVLEFGDEQFLEAFVVHGWDVTSDEDGSRVRLMGDEYHHPRPSDPRAHV
jgi:hypothetical protein